MLERLNAALLRLVELLLLLQLVQEQDVQRLVMHGLYDAVGVADRQLRKDLRHFLREKLPSHMIPSAFVSLDRLPLTPNGKVDRRRLPEPENRHPGLETSFVSPRTELEKTIAKIWQELLRVDKVGLHDNFFDLGGHSLLMTQVISRVREAFQVELPVRRFFESPTIAALARLIEDMLVEEIQQMSDDEARSLAPSAGSSP